MKHILKILLAVVLAIAGYYTAYIIDYYGKIESFCENEDKPEECKCSMKYILENITPEHRKELLNTMAEGYIKPSPDVFVVGVQAAFKCAK